MLYGPFVAQLEVTYTKFTAEQNGVIDERGRSLGINADDAAVVQKRQTHQEPAEQKTLHVCQTKIADQSRTASCFECNRRVLHAFSKNQQPFRMPTECGTLA